MKHEKIQIVTFLKQGQIPDATACMSRLLFAIIAVSVWLYCGLWTKDGDSERDNVVVR